MHNYESKEERKKFRIRTAIISSLLIVNVLVVYLYYYVLIFNAIAPGKVYGESTFKGGRYEVYTLKYYYQYKGISYFDKIDYVIGQNLNLGDSLHLRVLKPYPQKHMVDKVIRDESVQHQYDCEDGFNICYNEFIEVLDDYAAKDSEEIYSGNGHRVLVATHIDQKVKKAALQAIDNIHFNRGSIVDHYMLKTVSNAVYLYAVYHYMNDFSTDAMPSKIMHQELSRLLPKHSIHISVLELENAKKERQLDTTW